MLVNHSRLGAVCSLFLCLLYLSLSLFGFLPVLSSTNRRLFLFLSSQIIDHNSRDPRLSHVFVICGFVSVSVSSLKAKKERDGGGKKK